MNELNKFIKEMTFGIDENDKETDFRFDLLRWSKDEPYWCVFACEHKENTTITSGFEGVVSFGGHYCIGKEEGLHNVLSMLADSGWRVEVHPCFFMS